MRPRSIYVGGIIGRSVDTDHMLSVLRLVRDPAVARYQPTTHDALLCRARSKVATNFLEQTEDEVLLSIDSDIVFAPEQAIEICEQAVEYGIVAGVYITRARGKFCFPTSLAYDGTRVRYGDDPTPVEFRYVATGFVAVHRRVYEALAKRADCPLLHASESWRFRPFYTPFPAIGPSGEPIYLSEDWAFCERARQEGFPSYVNPAVRLQHLGLHPFRIEDMTQPLPPTMPMALTRSAEGGYHIEAFETPEPRNRAERRQKAPARR